MTEDKEKTVTKGMLDEAVLAILTGMDNLHQKHEKRFDEVDKRFEAISKEGQNEI